MTIVLEKEVKRIERQKEKIERNKTLKILKKYKLIDKEKIKTLPSKFYFDAEIVLTKYRSFIAIKLEDKNYKEVLKVNIDLSILFITTLNKAFYKDRDKEELYFKINLYELEKILILINNNKVNKINFEIETFIWKIINKLESKIRYIQINYLSSNNFRKVIEITRTYFKIETINFEFFFKLYENDKIELIDIEKILEIALEHKIKVIID